MAYSSYLTSDNRGKKKGKKKVKKKTTHPHEREEMQNSIYKEINNYLFCQAFATLQLRLLF